MRDYIKLANEKAYQLINSGALFLVSSVSKDENYDIAPIAWHCPIDYDKTTRLMFVTDKAHKTYQNILETKVFVISLPDMNQLQLVKDFGSCSGSNTNKFEKFKVETIDAEAVNCKMPDDCIGYIECKVYKVLEDGEVALVFGEAVQTKVDTNVYGSRLLTENEQCKPIYHLAGKAFTTIGDTIFK
jgi:flavin reductase (DIM6/NTAB) family NADH-FMN oxidoreductase RutF